MRASSKPSIEAGDPQGRDQRCDAVFDTNYVAHAGHQSDPVGNRLLRLRRRACPARCSTALQARRAAPHRPGDHRHERLSADPPFRALAAAAGRRPGVERRALPQPPQLHRRHHPARDRQRQGGDAAHLPHGARRGRYLPVKNVFVPLLHQRPPLGQFRTGLSRRMAFPAP